MRKEGFTPLSQHSEQRMSDEGKLLCGCVREGDMDGLLSALDNRKLPVEAIGPNGQTPLLAAVEIGNIDMVHELLNRGANVNAVDADGKSCLRHAVTALACRPPLVKALLDNGAELATRDKQHRTAQDVARFIGNPDVIRVLDNYDKMPRPLEPQDYSKAVLQDKMRSRKIALEAPANWQKWEEISAALEQRGEHFSKQEWLAEDGAGAESMMERAVNCRKLDVALATLKKQGESLTADDMLPDGKNPAAWVKALGDTRQIHQLFRAEMWQDKTPQDLRRVHAALPIPHRGQVHNYFQLKTSMEQAASQMAGKGAGR